MIDGDAAVLVMPALGLCTRCNSAAAARYSSGRGSNTDAKEVCGCECVCVSMCECGGGMRRRAWCRQLREELVQEGEVSQYVSQCGWQ